MIKHKLVCVQLIASASSNEYILSETYARAVDGAFSHVNNRFYSKEEDGFDRAFRDFLGVMTLEGNGGAVASVKFNHRKVRVLA